ncbi:MAG: hypothetical protein ACP5KV_02290 [Candidatus Methanomethylicaceae archaeon]
MRSALRRKSSCRVCGRSSAGEFCEFHAEAVKRLKEHFEVWRERKGTSWEEYLREILKNEMVGVWVKEVAEYLIRESQ